MSDAVNPEFEAVRRRPGMYFGPMGASAVEHVLEELVSNSIDQFLAGKATEVRVRLEGQRIEVSDDGPGLPFDQPSSEPGQSLATYDLTHFHRGASSDQHAPHVHIQGPRGMGLASVNAVSTWLHCQSWRNGHLWQQRFQDGIPTAPASVIEVGPGRGTRIAIVPEVKVLEADRPRSAVVRALLFQAVHLFPGLKAGFQDELFHAPNGLSDLVYIVSQPHSTEKMNWSDQHRLTLRLRVQDITIEGVIVGQSQRPCTWVTWVNGSPTPDHGSHRDGLLDALRRAGWNPGIVLLHVVTYDPQYAHPTKDQLDMPHIRNWIAEATTPESRKFCAQHGIKRSEQPRPLQKRTRCS